MLSKSPEHRDEPEVRTIIVWKIILKSFIVFALFFPHMSISAVGKDKDGHYSTLEISCTASHEEIRKAYRKLALRWHPDKNPSNTQEATRRFAGISRAYEVLGDPEKRRAYDQSSTSSPFDTPRNQSPSDPEQSRQSAEAWHKIINGAFAYTKKAFKNKEYVKITIGFICLSSCGIYIGLKVAQSRASAGDVIMSKAGFTLRVTHEGKVYFEKTGFAAFSCTGNI